MAVRAERDWRGSAPTARTSCGCAPASPPRIAGQRRWTHGKTKPRRLCLRAEMQHHDLLQRQRVPHLGERLTLAAHAKRTISSGMKRVPIGHPLQEMRLGVRGAHVPVRIALLIVLLQQFKTL